MLEVVLPRAADPQPSLRIGLAARRLSLGFQASGEIRPGERARLGEESRDRPRVHQLATLAARAGAEIDHVVGRLDERALVLDHDHRVARLREPPQHPAETGHVARVQAHGGLVEHVEHARERAAERRRERHPLRLAARERARLPAERQVAEAHVHQEAQPAADLVKHLLRGRVERGALRAAVPLAEDPLRLGHRERLYLGQRPPVEAEEPRLGAQPRAAAVVALAVAAVAREEDAHVHAVGARLQPLEEAGDAVPLALPALAGSPRLALPHEALHVLREVGVGHVFRQTRALQVALEVVLALAVEIGLEGLDGAARERPARVRDHQLRVDRHRAPEALAGLAGAHRVVEGEERGRRVAVADVAARAVQRGAEAARLRFALDVHGELALAVAQRRLERVHDPLALAGLDPETVEHDRDDAVLRVEPRLLDRDHDTSLEHAPEAGLLEGLAHHADPDLAPDPVRERDEGRLARSTGDERLDDRGRRVAAHRLAALPAVEHTRPRVERAQVVGDRGHRGDRRARGAHGRRAVDRDRRQHALDPLGPRPVEPLQELPRVGREGLGVAPMALGVEHVERERGLAGARDTRHGGDGADRDPDADVLQVVLARPHDLDEATGHPPRISGKRPAGKPTPGPDGGPDGPRATGLRQRLEPSSGGRCGRRMAQCRGPISTRRSSSGRSLAAARARY